MNNNYEDIINLDRPKLDQYPRMSIAARAAQFAPYKTITIYHDQIDNIENQSSVFAESEIIPDVDYYEHEETFSDFSNENLDNYDSGEL